MINFLFSLFAAWFFTFYRRRALKLTVTSSHQLKVNCARAAKLTGFVENP